jgi:hypothetical protein
VKEFTRFLEFTLINNTCWTKEYVMSNIHDHIIMTCGYRYHVYVHVQTEKFELFCYIHFVHV